MKRPYAELLKQHGFPELRQWIDLDDECTIRDIRLGFAEKLSSFLETVHQLVHPEDVTAMAESGLLTESEHESLELFYNRLVLLSKDSLLVDIASTPEEEVALIKRFIHDWPEIVAQVKRVIERTKEAYNGNKSHGYDTSYLG